MVNPFSYRSTDPKALRRTAHAADVVGERTDEAIRAASRAAQVTLVAWGADGAVGRRGAEVVAALDDPVCAGVAENGEPGHPLFVPTSTPFAPYRRS